MRKINIFVILGWSSTSYGAQPNSTAAAHRNQAIQPTPLHSASSKKEALKHSSLAPKAKNPLVVWKCNSIKKCAALPQIVNCLAHWQAVNEYGELKNIFIYLSRENHYKNIVGAYHHLLDKHLNSANTYKLINSAVSQVIPCSFKNCKCYKRNQMKQAKASHKSRLSLEYLFLQDLLDTIHTYLLHGYDSGHRYLHKHKAAQVNNTSMKPQVHLAYHNDEEEQKEDKNVINITNMFIDTPLKTLQQHQKAIKTPYYRARSDKFHTKINKVGKDNTDIRLYYWPHHKKSKQADRYHPTYKEKELYVLPAYASLKDEILSKSIAIHQWDTKMYAAKMLLHLSPTLKTLRAGGVLYRVYGIESGSRLSLAHLLSLLLYTDFVALCVDFSASFRYTAASESLHKLIKRHSKWHHLAKSIREVVEVYGEKIGTAKSGMGLYKGCFYHSVSDVRFDRPTVSYYGPLSTSKQLAVATLLTDKHGLVVALQEGTDRYAKYLRYFNASLVSRFAQEDEKLFIGGAEPLQVCGVRLPKENINTQPLMHTLLVLHHMIRGRTLLDIKRETAVKPLDITLLGKLLANSKEVPPYVRKTWDAFKGKQQMIYIDMRWVYQDYALLLPVLFSSSVKNLLLFDKLVQTFPHVTSINCITADCIGISNYSPSIVCDDFIGGLKDFLHKTPQKKLNSLEKITITTQQHPIKCNLLQKHFHALGWKMQKEVNSYGKQDHQISLTNIDKLPQKKSQKRYAFL